MARSGHGWDRLKGLHGHSKLLLKHLLLAHHTVVATLIILAIVLRIKLLQVVAVLLIEQANVALEDSASALVLINLLVENLALALQLLHTLVGLLGLGTNV